MPAGVVLCGGKSSRMGRDKTTIPWDGAPLYEHVAARLARVADPVFLAPGAPGRLDSTRPQVEDLVAGGGPLAGIVPALQAAGDDVLLVVAADMPDVSPELLAHLAELTAGHDAAVPVTGRPQPLHAAYAPSALAPLRAAWDEGERSITRALARLDVVAVGSGVWRRYDPNGSFAFSINSPGDLQARRRGSSAP